MIDQTSDNIFRAIGHIYDALGKSRLLEYLHDFEHCQSHLLARFQFQNNGIAGHQCDCQVPMRDHEWKVEWNDACHHAQWIASDSTCDPAAALTRPIFPRSCSNCGNKQAYLFHHLIAFCHVSQRLGDDLAILILKHDEAR